MCRISTPSTSPNGDLVPRFAYEDLEIAQVEIPQGDIVIPGADGREQRPRSISGPRALDITPAPNRHVAFGFGIHYCLGAPLARLEAAIVVGSLLERRPRIDFASDRDDLEWSSGFFLRGVRHLPVRI